MAYLKLQFITKDRDRHGNLRFYFRRTGKPKIRLRGLPGSEEFMAAYKEALSETSMSEAEAEKSFGWLCGRYYKSSYFQALEPETRRRKRVVLDDICGMTDAGGRKFGLRPFDILKRTHVRKLRDLKADRPAAADLLVNTVSGLFNWAIKNDIATVNPAEKLEKLGAATEGHYTWTDDDIKTFETYWPIGSRPRLAMAIMLYLGVRRSDAAVIGKQHESPDGQMVTFQVFKGRKKNVCVLALPILPPLRAILDASELGQKAWVESDLGNPYSNAGFSGAFKDWCKEAGLPQCNCHGLRKAGAVRAAEAGVSEYELMAMFGWANADMARIYTRKAAQKKMAASGAAKVAHSRGPCPTDCPTA